MALDDTALTEEINAVLNQGALPVHFQYTVSIKLPNQTTPLYPQRLASIDTKSDYDKQYCDEIKLSTVMGIGDYQHLLIPNANNLQVTVTKQPLLEGTDAPDLSQPALTTVYRGTLYRQSSGAVSGNDLFSNDPQSGNLTGMTQVDMQLVDLTIEQTRMQSAGTIMRQTSSSDALTFWTNKIAQGLQVDEDHTVKGIYMVPPDNPTVYKNVVIPHTVKGVDFPRYFAAKVGSPYSSGFGAYYARRFWWIYPLFNLSLFDKAKQTLTVISVPKNRMPQSPRTYRTTGNQVIVLATEGGAHADPSETLQLVQGNGTRYADAGKMFDSFVTTQDNVATAQRALNINEYVGEDRSTGFNNVLASDKPITTNHFAEMGKIAARMGSIVQVTWTNADPDLIFPGMPCQYLYEVAGQVFSLKGQVVATQSFVESVQQGMIPGPHRCTVAINMFVQKALQWNDDSTQAEASSANA